MEYWIIINEQQQGPYTLEELATKAIVRETPVWHDGMPDWMPAGDLPELASMLPPVIPQPLIPELPAVVPELPAEAMTQGLAQPAGAPSQAAMTATQGAAMPSQVLYAPVNAIPAGYVPVTPAGEVKIPNYLAWAIVSTVLFFLPTGVVAIICSLKTKKHIARGDYAKASKLSERAALFICLSVVLALIWYPFSMVFSMF